MLIQYSLSPFSTFIVDCHGYHFELVATAVLQGSLVVKKSHAAHSNTLSPKAASSVRDVGVRSARCGSADASTTIIVLFAVCPLTRLHTAAHCFCDTVLLKAGCKSVSRLMGFMCTYHLTSTGLGHYLHTAVCVHMNISKRSSISFETG